VPEKDGRGPLTLRIVVVAALVSLLDQITKWTIISILEEREGVNIVGDILRICHLRNEGLVFGFLRGHPHLCALLTSLVLLAILFSLGWIKERGGGMGTGGGLILGGAAGNLFDRIFHGGVIDLLDIGIGGLRWPAFNLADIGICFGAGILIYSWFKEKGDD
jgi:signal peptidase II